MRMQADNVIEEVTPQPIVRTASLRADHPDAAQEIARLLRPDDLDTVILFASPRAEITALVAGAQRHMGRARVVGCTTAGEINASGYTEGEIVAIGLPRSQFRSRAVLLEKLEDIPTTELVPRLLSARSDLISEAPTWDHEFAFLMVDGMSLREDVLVTQVATALGPIPLFGGSAGDMNRFSRTQVFAAGKALQKAAVLLMVRSRCPIRVFRTDHFAPLDRHMVVTRADPDARIVSEINGAPAGPEYARILGKDPAQLDTFTFASHPVVVKVGGRHHVRAIQRVAPTGDLHFFSAIGEGLVLTLAGSEDMPTHLDRELADLAKGVTPDIVLGCDCILRRLEAEQKQVTGALSAILARHRVHGFSTYGEQHGAMHVNQTLTGVAIYPPPEDLP
ncbi:GfdT protein [Pseudooceanicola sediminis]|uniref:GfdT protein n=1 Tax=Pseudooceanicola sediminis TaxID=2211117 RepID=A0A399IWT2_9RHOB|nr:FIST N-terminal domain-containing protein [Pseudooceanicola sediminis]KAA2312985.1 GfdT protein [Puniceibacterium sp. HSS470]RII37615.1 GfdT protein [Pseudooceanicola sediminis]|tara:strand:- start:15744 stop:16919 length:1176 start_codon:yes stop_codon:yes gene_type:complete